MNWKLSKEMVIGAILVIVVIAGGALYSNDIFRLMAAHPDKNLFVIVQPDKNEVNVIQRVGSASFNRYRVMLDEICQYEGSRKIGCYSWYVDYFRTYGDDEWVNQARKKSLITMEADENEQRVFVKKITPYYAYNYAGGSDGVMEETITAYQDHTDFTVSYKPERMKALHQLRMKVTEIDSSVIPFDFGGQTSIKFDDKYEFILRWDGSPDSFDHHKFDGKALILYFKAKAGEINLG